MFKQMSLAGKIIGGFVVVVALTIVLGVVSFTSANKMMGESNKLLNSYFPLINAIIGIQVDLGEGVFGIHEYILEMENDPKGGYAAVKEKSKSNNFKDPIGRYEEGLGEILEAIEKKNGAIEVDKEVAAGFDKTKGAVMELDSRAKTIFASKAGKDVRATADSKMTEIYGLYDHVDDFLDESQTKIEQQISVSVAASHAAHNTAINTIIFMSIFSAIVGLLTGILLTRSIVNPINRVISVLKNGSDQVTSASNQLSASSQELAQGASEQAASLEETAASIEEMSSMIQRNAENTRQARDMSNEANRVATDGVESMSRLSNSISEIQASSAETAKIIKTIDEIAFQTNLLALNAAVEAARAGEAGKGFAVVAEEVRNLAKRSAEAAKNTSELITSSQKNVDNGVAVTADVRKILGEIGKNVTKVKDLMNEVSASSEEQAKGIDQINKAVNEMDSITQRTSANAEESASASEELSAQSEELKGTVVQLVNIVSKDKAGELEYTSPVKAQKRAAAPATVIKHAAAYHAAQRQAYAKKMIPLDESDSKTLREF